MPAADPNSFFPIDVKFTANKTFCDIKVRYCILDNCTRRFKRLNSYVSHVYSQLYHVKSNSLCISHCLGVVGRLDL